MELPAQHASDFMQLLTLACAEAESGAAALVPVERQPLLNGAPYRAFRQSLDIVDRRRAGTFFSGPALAQDLVRLLQSTMPAGGLVLDPTCGIGDLLLAYAASLPIAATLSATLMAWGEQLAGIELRPDLVLMAKTRLMALARARGRFSDPVADIERLFPHIVVGDMFQEPARIATAAGILFNPPFGRTSDHKGASWGSGRLSAAALFLDAVLRARASSTPIAAVLPEVLRCGSRYGRFRDRLAEAGISGAFESHGQFDQWTDIDVFTTLLLPKAGALWPAASAIQDRAVGDAFTVRVGPVVPHRDPCKGPWRRYICAKSVPAWSDAFEPVLNRRFQGTSFTPPFVVVRRTSSPKDRKRAVGAIIVGDRPVAVENHLLVLMPKDGQLQSCVALLRVLSSDAATDHLNQTIRCRHLTTGSVSTISWPETT